MNGKGAAIKWLIRLLKPSGPDVIKLLNAQLNRAWTFKCSQNIKCLKIKAFLCVQMLRFLFIMLINIKMPTIVGILTFMSMINFMFS